MPDSEDQNPPTEPKPPKGPRKPKEPRTKRSESAVPRSIVGRAGRIAATSIKGSMRLAMLGPKALIDRDAAKQMLTDVHAATVQDLAQTLGRLKGASMKVGQLASFIDAGVLPPELRDMYQDAFASLRDSAPPMENKLIRQIFVREFDSEPAALYASFNLNPVAAASLGQVHRGVTHDGRDVAVKLQYPGIENAIRSDLAMTSVVKPMVPLLAPGLEVDDAIAEIKARVLEECDYITEASHLDFLADKYSNHPFVMVPRSLPELSSRRVLTMEWVSGAGFDEMKRLPQAERNRIGEILYRFYYGSLHRYGFTSADPHPGNYLLLEDGRMACFDFGLACELPDAMRPLLKEGFLALIEGDVHQLFETSVKMGYIRRKDRIDADRFYEWVRWSLSPMVEDREYTFTRDFIAERTAAMLDMRNPWWAFIRQLNLPRWAILIYRLELGIFAVLAQLGATANWHQITKEFYGEAEPSTEIGRVEERWRASSDQ